MMYLEQNIKGLCDHFGLDFQGWLSDFDIDSVHELTMFDLQAICEEYTIDLHALLFKPLYLSNTLKSKLEKIKLLVIDVDGVMTDGGMYFTENGDQLKKYNTKDGMAIMHLTKNDFKVAIISSGFKSKMVEARAELLNIQHCIVSREKKIDVLQRILEEENLTLDNVAMIGDDINDIQVMKQIGFSACPADAVNAVKAISTIILQKEGGRGCVREFIDTYLLKEPLN